MIWKKSSGKAKFDKEQLYAIREYAANLSEGIDPTSGIKFSEDTILNIDKVKKYNQNVFELVNFLISKEVFSLKKGSKSGKKAYIKIKISDSEKKLINFSEIPISISKLVFEINKATSEEKRKIRAIEITKWLERKHYLESLAFKNGKYYKKSTTLGNEFGISFEEKKDKEGNVYGVNLYNKVAQVYIVDNLDKIINEN
jgi:hypothetical protein